MTSLAALLATTVYVLSMIVDRPLQAEVVVSAVAGWAPDLRKDGTDERKSIGDNSGEYQQQRHER
jgi:hypothetical protein